jgi:hypothetical protein
VVKVIDHNSFKTTVGDQPILPFENSFFMIKLRKGSYVKIGVCKSDSKQDVELAFCDDGNGWALYNGELRHNNNKIGKAFGTGIPGGSRAEEGDTIGVLIERKHYGRIGFTKNGKYLGVAFEDKRLMYGMLYPAIAPIYKGHTFEIVQPEPED